MISLLIIVGGFLAFCGLGMANALVVALGVIVAAVGPVMTVVLNSRNRVRLYVLGNALVEDVTARPGVEGRTARGRLKLTIRATGINGVSVTGTDPAIPLDKWPERGATLPVQVLKGNPRKFTVQWDKVQTHQESMVADLQSPAGGASAQDDRYSLDGDDYGPPSGDAYADLDLPPDDRPTLTDLPPIQAPIREPVRTPVGASAGRGAGTALQDPVVSNPALAEPVQDAAGEQVPEIARHPARPARHAVSEPAHHTAEPIGAGSTTALAFAGPQQRTPGTAEGTTTSGTTASAARAEPLNAEPLNADTADTDPVARADPSDTADPAAAAAPQDEPIVMRLPSKPQPGGPHRRPSPHPRSGSHDRVRRPRPRPSTPRPATESPDGLALMGTTADPETYSIPEAGSLVSAPAPAPATETASETASDTAGAKAEPVVAPAPEIEWWTDAAATDTAVTDTTDSDTTDTDTADTDTADAETAVEPAPPALEWYPDRETEQPPIRATRPGERLRVAPYIDGDALNEARNEPPAAPAAAASEVEETAAAPHDAPETHPSGSAWSANGHGPAPAALYNAPPIWRRASSPAPADDAEETAPDPYVTEHYLPPEDQLEEQPLSEGAVAEFLATAPRRQPMPLDGVNGVSITLIVSDLQRSRRFYRDTLGLTELDTGPTSAVLETGSARVVLRRVADMPPVDRRVVHLNLDVPDVYEAYERLREQGVDFVHRPRVVPQGEQLELCSATFRDPDGHAIALTRWELRR